MQSTGLSMQFVAYNHPDVLQTIAGKASGHRYWGGHFGTSHALDFKNPLKSIPECSKI